MGAADYVRASHRRADNRKPHGRGVRQGFRGAHPRALRHSSDHACHGRLAHWQHRNDHLAVRRHRQRYGDVAKLNVTDIFITGELGFWLPLVKENAKGKKIRAICNISQADDFPRNMFKYDSLHTFFIRPEDIDEYAKYIDTFEFAETAKHTYNVFYDLYCNKKRWAGPLKEIIKGYEGEEDSAYILPHFGSTRASCRKKCGWMGCYLCFNIANLGRVLK